MQNLKKVRNLTFFDLDGTLLTVNSGFKFGLFLFRKRVLPLSRFFYLLAYYLWFKLGLLSPEEANEKACILFLNGMNLNFMHPHVTELLDSELEGWINQKVFSRFKQAKENKEFTVLLSSSPEFLVKQIAERLGFNFWEATRYRIDSSGIVQGIQVNMDGENKARFVKELCGRLGVDMKETTAYSDSIFDLPFLQAAGWTVAVNPDRKLRQLALEKKWEIL